VSTSAPPDIVLASTSRYRRELLTRLTSSFRVQAPLVDETALEQEAPLALAGRLALAKAQAVAADCGAALVIGSDQVAELDGRALGKPGSVVAAHAQLAACSGRAVDFHTALCVIDTRGGADTIVRDVDRTRVVFRTLDTATIERYVQREQPLDCAGSFKCEGLGIALFERIETTDPTALVGLPLIALARLLRGCGIELP
jgi:septum formation protein